MDSDDADPTVIDPLDRHLPPSLRAELERRYWAPIDRAARLELLRDDPSFYADPGRHPSMFADHGVVHVRNIAAGVVELYETVAGTRVPRVDPERRRFIEIFGVAIAYVHDIGMVDLSPAGRRTHALFAAHEAFGSGVEGLVAHLVADGPFRRRLDRAAAQAPFRAPIDVVAREMLSLTVAHSKSVVPSWLLSDRVALRRLMWRIISTPMSDHRTSSGLPTVRPTTAADVNDDIADDGPDESFAWLCEGAHADLADDVVTAVRVLRAADALRQRGSVLRTSAGFEICVDVATGYAVCTLRSEDGDAAYTLTFDDPMSSGEANVKTSVVTGQGHLRIAFHGGTFRTEEATRRAVDAAAVVLDDVTADVLTAFDDVVGASEGAEPMRVEIERPVDGPGFAAAVAAALIERRPDLGERTVCVADTESAADVERNRYLGGAPLDEAAAHALLGRLARHGTKIDDIDATVAFADVVTVHVAAGEVLVEQGSPPAFVYIPNAAGLVVHPGGGYAPSPMHPWVPIGVTGLIRRAGRNSRIVADEDVEVVMIPAETYRAEWFRPFTASELRSTLGTTPAGSTGSMPAG